MLSDWLGKLEDAGFRMSSEVDGVRVGASRSWRRPATWCWSGRHCRDRDEAIIYLFPCGIVSVLILDWSRSHRILVLGLPMLSRYEFTRLILRTAAASNMDGRWHLSDKAL